MENTLNAVIFLCVFYIISFTHMNKFVCNRDEINKQLLNDYEYFVSSIDET